MMPVIVIPAYNPDHCLISLIEQLGSTSPESPIIVVNDGSGSQCQPIFDAIEQAGHTVLHHAVNQGKGAALKTAFRTYLSNFAATCCGIITADADGQHQVEDINRISSVLRENPTSMHLGTRSFKGQNIPLRSRFGNVLTKIIVNCFYNPPLQDTQSGLRGIPNQLVEALIRCPTNRYEFELEMFFIARSLNIPINQLQIKTIYMQNNQSSHFRPILDSMRIYAIFFRYGALALLSFILDFTLFCLFINLSGNLSFSVLGARMCSATFNFLANKHLTFKSQKSYTRSAGKYALLATFSGIMIWQLTALLHFSGMNLYVSKIGADVIFFCLNFLLQRYWVFKDKMGRHVLS